MSLVQLLLAIVTTTPWKIISRGAANPTGWALQGLKILRSHTRSSSGDPRSLMVSLAKHGATRCCSREAYRLSETSTLSSHERHDVVLGVVAQGCTAKRAPLAWLVVQAISMAQHHPNSFAPKQPLLNHVFCSQGSSCLSFKTAQNLT